MSDDPTTDDDGDEEDRGDPFDSLDEYRDRDGDPFDSFGDDPDRTRAGRRDGDDAARGTDDATGGADESATPESSDSADPDPFEYMGDRNRGGSDANGTDSVDGPEDPLADVAVSEEDPFESASSAFERSGVEGIDPDEVWDRLTAEPEADDADRGGVDPTDEGEDDTVTVSKHSYCEGCEHFSPPPDVTCAHEGTDILEFVGVDEVRVSDCPVVDERRELEEDA